MELGLVYQLHLQLQEHLVIHLLEQELKHLLGVEQEQ